MFTLYLRHNHVRVDYFVDMELCNFKIMGLPLRNMTLGTSLQQDPINMICKESDENALVICNSRTAD